MSGYWRFMGESTHASLIILLLNVLFQVRAKKDVNFSVSSVQSQRLATESNCRLPYVFYLV